MVLVVTVSCHCLSLTLYIMFFRFFVKFDQLRLKANLRRYIKLQRVEGRGYTESLACR